jgi:hypothetical protein
MSTDTEGHSPRSSKGGVVIAVAMLLMLALLIAFNAQC